MPYAEAGIHGIDHADDAIFEARHTTFKSVESNRGLLFEFSDPEFNKIPELIRPSRYLVVLHLAKVSLHLVSVASLKVQIHSCAQRLNLKVRKPARASPACALPENTQSS